MNNGCVGVAGLHDRDDKYNEGLHVGSCQTWPVRFPADFPANLAGGRAVVVFVETRVSLTSTGPCHWGPEAKLYAGFSGTARGGLQTAATLNLTQMLVECFCCSGTSSRSTSPPPRVR